MKKTITKSTMLIASIMALAAFAMPSMASAANWGPFNTNHTLTGIFVVNVPTNPYYSITKFGCNTSVGVHARLPLSSTLDVTSATFSGCSVISGAGIDCKVTAVASGLPWTATGTSTSDVRINVADIAVTYSNPNPVGGPCAYLTTGHVSGTLTGGAWSAAGHSITYSNDTGLGITYSVGPSVGVQTTVNPLADSGVNPLTLT